jgi:putative phosphoesterase
VRLAIISDIHGNLEALHATLQLIEEREIEDIVCLGDIVGYGADPEECLALVKRRCQWIVRGNHDHAMVHPEEIDSFTPNARIAAMWTMSVLSNESKELLGNLPMTLRLEEILLVHASPLQPEEWNYILSPVEALSAFPHFKERICFYGHTHVPGVFSESSQSSASAVSKSDRLLVNVGSVGQPRDGNPQLSFGVFDTAVWSYENVRAPYDAKAAAEKILKAGMPKRLADRLLTGS